MFVVKGQFALRSQLFTTDNFSEPNGAPLDIKEVQWSLRLGSRSPYTSFDRTISDAAWQNLSIGSNQGWLKLPKEKLEQIGQMAPDRVGFADGSGYLLGMDVFHQLHCLNYLRKKTILYHGIYPESAPDEIPADIHIPIPTRTLIDTLRSSLYRFYSAFSAVPFRHEFDTAALGGWLAGTLVRMDNQTSMSRFLKDS
ncbi:hypothetical protein BKA65DRAFT_538778 [Rhexocercosporidium sp. MPI-PUGE-AT-0058]|nr:hypothetical protein BKA65DRAFT_538778 [Rhexocercosporidium sp. MPI-PUGE-AT-0058]